MSEVFPSKRFGQHFLKDKRTIQRIIDALAPKPDETIIEIGPGTGALTTHLVERAGHVVAVEFDNKLTPLLNDQFGSLPNFKLVMADALKKVLVAHHDRCRAAARQTLDKLDRVFAVLRRLRAMRMGIQAEALAQVTVKLARTAERAAQHAADF